MIKMSCKIAFSLIPFSIMRMKLSEGILEHLTPAKEEHKDLLRRMASTSGQMIGVMIWIPALIIAVTTYACMEYTPITGRWRWIMFSPEEEENVARQLEGMGWFNAIADILFADSSTSSPPRVIPVSDWRYIWAERVLRRLEAAIPHLQGASSDAELQADYPRPPPSEYPLEPRQRIAQRLHELVEAGNPNIPAPHTLLGVPHNLLLVENEDDSNGFSFGISGNGSSGIVVYSGFFDEIAPNVRPPPGPNFLWRLLFGAPPPCTLPSAITPEQTAKLAVLLAHELAHLVLAHHVETLSASSVLIPGLTGFWIDILRTLIYPWTMMWGPFLNDHLWTKTQEKQQAIRNLHAANFNRVFELEADVVSARILAYAGFDPRLAIDFWSNRPCTEDSEAEVPEDQLNFAERWWKRATKTHPLREHRVQRLTEEIESWTPRWRGPTERFRDGKPLTVVDVVG